MSSPYHQDSSATHSALQSHPIATKKTPTPYTVRRATRAEIVEHQERNVLILNHCVRNATAKTVCHLDDKVNNARKLRRTKHKREAAGPVAHVLGILRKREAQQRKSHAVFVASSKDPFVGAGEEAPGAAPAGAGQRFQTQLSRSGTNTPWGIDVASDSDRALAVPRGKIRKGIFFLCIFALLIQHFSLGTTFVLLCFFLRTVAYY